MAVTSCRGQGLKTQKQWLAFYAELKGLFGWMLSKEALLDRYGKSLLISGVTKAEGDFSDHDIVSVYHQESGQLLEKARSVSANQLCAICSTQKAMNFIHWMIDPTPEIDLLYRI